MSVGRAASASAAVLAACACLAIGSVNAQVAAPARVSVVLPPSYERYRPRLEGAAAESMAQYEQWLGPLPAAELTMRGVASMPEAAAAGDPLVIHLPWLAAESAMQLEAQAAFALAMQYWPHEPEAASLARGLSCYLQGRVVERLFNVRYARPGYSAESVRFFGGYVPWAFPSLRVSRWTAGLHDDPAARGFAALERYLGWPVLQGALRSLAASMQERRLTLDHTRRVVSDAAGQDLTWFFDAAFNPAVRVDYALTELTAMEGSPTCSPPRCYRTQVAVVRRGNGVFSGSSQTPVGDFEAGGGITVRVAFGDAQSVTAAWDGRSNERTFEFQSAAPAESARLNPEGALLIDPTRLDHVRYSTPVSNVPLAKWVSRWLVWLQDALLTYSMIV